MYREITIRAVMNGFLCNVGCQQVVFRSNAELLTALDAYLRDPEGTEKDFSQHPNARHTLNNPLPTPTQERLKRLTEMDQCATTAVPTMGQAVAGNYNGR